MATSHSNLLNLTLLEISHARIAKAWRNETGTAKSFDNERVIKYGLKGSSDILGLTKSGRFLAIEIKVGKDFLKPEQINFKDTIERYNGLHFVIRSEDDIKEMIKCLERS